MKRESKLEKRLQEWVSEYGGGKHAQLEAGTSWLWSLIKWHGRAPTGLGYEATGSTAADEVQAAVEALQRQKHGWTPAAVLRCEYFSGASKYEKLHRLARIGLKMDETRYSQHLRVAKIHIAAWLKLPFSEPLDVEQEIAMLEYLVENEG